MTDAVPRVRNPSPEAFFREFVAPGRPVILTEALAAWPARSWSLATLVRDFGDWRLPVEVLPEDRAEDNAYRAKHLEVSELPLREYWDKVQSVGSRMYAAQIPLDLLPPAMRDGVGALPYFPPDATARTGFFWLGPAGVRSGLHYDVPSNLVAQLVGTKRWTIFPASQRRLLYTPSVECVHFSPIILDAPDTARYPRFRHATPITFELHAGEVLYLPRCWPHEVRALEESVTLNYFFRTPGDALDIWTLKLLSRARRLREAVRQRLEPKPPGSVSPQP